MSTPALPVSDRYFAVGITNLFWLPDVAASTGIPTRAELTAGTLFEDEIVGVTGWQVEPNNFNVNTLGNRVSPSMSGRLQMPSSTLTFAASRDGVDIRTVLEEGDLGHIVWADGGDIEDYWAEQFPVEVSSIAPLRTLDEREHQLQVAFSIKNTPVRFQLPASA